MTSAIKTSSSSRTQLRPTGAASGATPTTASSTVPWPFPDQLIRHHDAPPLSSTRTPTYADMTTELGEAQW